MFGSILSLRFVRQHAYHKFTAVVYRPSVLVPVSICYKSSLAAAAAAGAAVQINSDILTLQSHVPGVEKKKSKKPKGRQPKSEITSPSPSSKNRTPKVEKKESKKPRGRQLNSEITKSSPSKTSSSSRKSAVVPSRASPEAAENLKNTGTARELKNSIESAEAKSPNDPVGPKLNSKGESLKEVRKRYIRLRLARKKAQPSTRPILSHLVGEVKDGEGDGSKNDKGPSKPSAQHEILKEKPPESTKSPNNPVIAPDRANLSEIYAWIATNQFSRRDKARILHLLRNPIPAGRLPRPLRYNDKRRRKVQRETSKVHARPEPTRIAVGKKMKEETVDISRCEMETIEATDLELVPINKPQPTVPRLAYGLERVLFNPGVYQLQDPRSRVFNFDPYLQSIMPVTEFDFGALQEYITSSRDETLTSTAAAEGKKYTGSTSSMTAALAHFHFLLSQWRPVNTSNLSQGFPEKLRSFTLLQRAPSAIFLKWKDGTYAIDADKEFDTSNVLMMLGKSMEKLLTLRTSEFERYRKENSEQITDDERNEDQSYHYTTMGDFLMRSQLDAYDPRVPGTGMFDLKTRAVVSVRMDTQNYHVGSGYEIRSRFGEFESYEREYYDMIRAAFLKYSLQVRMGRMDGIFVAFHNVERIFGFQYISLPEMDLAIHGQEDVTLGDSEFKLSLELLNRVLDRATTRFPEQSLRIFFETRDATTPFTYIFAMPITEEEIQAIQESKRAEIEEYERDLLGLNRTSPEAKNDKEEHLRARKEKQIELEKASNSDELNTEHGSRSHEGVDLDGVFKRSVDELHSSSYGEAKLVTGEPNEEQPLTSSIENDPANAINDKIKRNVTEDLLHKENERHVYIASGAFQTSNNVQGEGEHLSTVDPGDNEGKEESQQSAKINEPELLAMTLKIKNKVNGKYVVRPTDTGPDDRWSVEYNFAEVSNQAQARSLLEASKRRREAGLLGNKIKEKSRFNHSFSSKLRELSEQGRRWRLKQTEIEKSNPVTMLKDHPFIS